ncbi:hypothetical protein PVAND_013272 [Polypedilum vanderplanki]|uniref:Thioredoxin domain-containing protein n=1 Tax=Polypedilum vanderplanki TaxID=319348 RepID=A0A9J6CR14_POLVA|nr:hypothetical protein PVAND_013272 [Polypedilum vanderplanki]
MFKIICLLVIFLTTAHGRIIQNDLIILTPENFDQITESQNIFVTFIYDFEVHEKFIELLEEIKKTASESDDVESRMLKFGIFDCKKNIMKCKSIGLGHKIEVRFYGNQNKWPALSEFLDQIVDEVLQEDELIESLDKPGRFLVLFKIASCIYCKETLKHWKEVKDYFRTNEYIKIYTLDCTRRRPICRKFDVSKYPKIRFFYNSRQNRQQIFEFEDSGLDRTKEGIIKFTTEHLHLTFK